MAKKRAHKSGDTTSGTGKAKSAKSAKSLKSARKQHAQQHVVWASTPAEHDYPAAASFLGLLGSSTLVEVVTSLLSQAPPVHQHAKDVLRAARLPLLGRDDPEVAKDLARIAAGVALSPVLLVRGDLRSGRALQIADGYHRVCAGYHVEEDTEIVCRIADLPAVEV